MRLSYSGVVAFASLVLARQEYPWSRRMVSQVQEGMDSRDRFVAARTGNSQKDIDRKRFSGNTPGGSAAPAMVSSEIRSGITSYYSVTAKGNVRSNKGYGSRWCIMMHRCISVQRCIYYTIKY